jgi:nucleoside-diphosphate-sugar epimerase
MSNPSPHVVFGTGQIGRLVASRLAELGHDVIAVNRSGRGAVKGGRVIGGDATDPEFTTAISTGAAAVYFCLNATDYTKWAEQFPPLQKGVLAGASAAGARLVVLDNLYAYGPVGGRDLVETMAAQPTSKKSATRAAMTEELLAAHASGRVEVAIGRASDYFGPGVRQSALGDSVFGAALRGKTAQVMGDPTTLHSYSYAPDVADALITLGVDARAAGQIWHLPVAPARSTKQLIATIYELAGRKAKVLAAGGATLRTIGLFKPVMREYLHTLYQFTDRWVVDDSKFRNAFGTSATHLDEALSTTLAWSRNANATATATADSAPAA